MPAVPLPLVGPPGVELRADCSRCFALCCSALGFQQSSDFAHDKPAGEACRNLAPDFACTMHARLRGEGYKGCTVFDCFGAGQHLSQRTFQGRSWTAQPDLRVAMFAAFPVMRQLHELLWHLQQAQRLCDDARWSVPAGAGCAVDGLLDETTALTGQDAEALQALDLDALRRRTGDALGAVSAAVRAGRGQAKAARRMRPGADLLGAPLAGRDLRGADLRGSCLIAADLAGADLRWVDLLGADLRDARLHGADLSEALFSTQMQANAAQGDDRTRLPAELQRPSHWIG